MPVLATELIFLSVPVGSGPDGGAEYGDVLFPDDLDIVDAAFDEIDIVAQIIQKHGAAGLCQGMLLPLRFFKNLRQVLI